MLVKTESNEVDAFQGNIELLKEKVNKKKEELESLHQHIQEMNALQDEISSLDAKILEAKRQLEKLLSSF